ISSKFTTNVVARVSTDVVYEFHTPSTTSYVQWSELLPDRVPVITTNYISNLGQLFPTIVTNYLTNTFRLVSSAVRTNQITEVQNQFVYAFIIPGVTNFIDLPTRLPDSIQVVTTNLIDNLGQQYPVAVTNVVLNK